MSHVNSYRKVESGSELLARLQTRPNVQEIDAFIFGDSSPSSSSGQIVEIFGSEGVGKSELTLYCAAKACLPTKSNGIDLKGLGSKVVIVDTEYKFSILRFTVVLEKQIQQVLATMSRNTITTDISEKTSHFDSPKEPMDTSNKSGTMKHNSLLETQERSNVAIAEGIPDKPVTEISDLDLETIINDSLSRVFVLRVNSSLQLLASLMSIEQSVSEDHLYSLLILDTISSYHWIDKAACSDSYACREKNMSAIANVISHLVNHFGITCLAVSSALFMGQNKKQTSLADGAKGGKAELDGGSDAWMHSEFLGKTWVSSRTRRIVMVKNKGQFDTRTDLSIECDRLHDNTDTNIVCAICLSTRTKKRFVMKDDCIAAL